MFIVQSMRFIFLILLTVISAAYAEDEVKPPTPSLVIQLEISGIIGPATADYLVRSLQKAIDRQAMAVLIVMDTPGGLDFSMRQIIKKIIASPPSLLSVMYHPAVHALPVLALIYSMPVILQP